MVFSRKRLLVDNNDTTQWIFEDYETSRDVNSEGMLCLEECLYVYMGYDKKKVLKLF